MRSAASGLNFGSSAGLSIEVGVTTGATVPRAGMRDAKTGTVAQSTCVGGAAALVIHWPALSYQADAP